jgi:hypothetical protein
LDRLGLRARDARRSEPPLTAGGDATPAAFDLNGGLGATAQPAATRQAGEAMTDMRDQVQLKLDETDRTDLSLADTFCAMKALASNPQSPPGAIPDRIERVARALCQADGRDPDRSIETGQWQTVLSGGHETQRPVTLRGWKVYEKDAKQFVAALDAALDRS